MNEDYPDELFICQNCRDVKEHTTLLECFHNICNDCELINEQIVCTTCPHQFTLPEKEHRIKHPLNDLLFEVLNPPEGTKPIEPNCTFCEENNDTKFCKECKTFWCENDLIQVHHKVIHMGARHVFIPAAEATSLDVNPLPEGSGGEEDETTLDELIKKMKKLEGRGNKNQIILRNNQEEVEVWRRSQEEKIDGIFDEIIKQVKQNKTKIIQDLNFKCNDMQESLEINQEENEKKLSIIRRGLKMLDKMKQHKTKSDSMQQFLSDRQILETNHTSSPLGIVQHVELNKLEKLPKKLMGDKFLAKIAVEDISIEKSKLFVNQEGEDDVTITIEIYLKGNYPDPIKGDIMGNDINVIISGDSIKQFAIPYKGRPIKVSPQLPTGKYQAQLKINTCLKQETRGFTIHHNANFATLNPQFISLDRPGLHRAVASAGNYLYCVVKDPPEIRKYIVPKNFDAGSDGLSFEIQFGQGNLATPCGICYVEEHLYVADAGHNCIFQFTNCGDYVDRIGKDGKELGQFQRPMGVDFDHLKKELLIADTFNNRVQILSMATRQFTQFGSSEYFKMKEPVDVKALQNGNAVLTTLGGLILLYDNARNFTKLIMTEILTPRHCCVDSADNIYVTSHLGHSVYKLSPMVGEFEEFEKVNLITVTEFRCPTGIAMSKEGHLFVVSRELNPESTKSFLSIW